MKAIMYSMILLVSNTAIGVPLFKAGEAKGQKKVRIEKVVEPIYILPEVVITPSKN